MRRVTKLEISRAAQQTFDKWVSMYGLVNAKKVVSEAKRMLLAEDKRRKTLRR